MSTPSRSIGFVTVADLPEGCGRTARLRTLVGALVGMGHRVQIWNEHGLESSGGEQISGKFAGAQYEYVLGTTTRQYGFRAISLKVRAVSTILKRVRAAAKSGHLDAVFFNNLAFYDTFPITRLAQRLGIATIQCYEDERYEVVSERSLDWPGESSVGIHGLRIAGVPPWQIRSGRSRRTCNRSTRGYPVIQSASESSPLLSIARNGLCRLSR